MTSSLCIRLNQILGLDGRRRSGLVASNPSLSHCSSAHYLRVICTATARVQALANSFNYLQIFAALYLVYRSQNGYTWRGGGPRLNGPCTSSEPGGPKPYRPCRMGRR